MEWEAAYGSESFTQEIAMQEAIKCASRSKHDLIASAGISCMLFVSALPKFITADNGRVRLLGDSPCQHSSAFT